MQTNLEILKRLEAEATPGPWEWEGRRVDEDGYVFVPQCSYLGGTLINLADTYENHGADCDVLAAARNALPLMLAVVEAAEHLKEVNSRPANQDNLLAIGKAHISMYAALAKFNAAKISGGGK